MKRANIIRNGKIILTVLFCLLFAGCGNGANGLSGEAKQTANGNELLEEAESTVDQSESSGESGPSADLPEKTENAGETDPSSKEEHARYPVAVKWQEGYHGYDPEDTIFYKSYYNDSVGGRRIKYPDIDKRDELEEYFLYRHNAEKWENLVEMFLDERTVEMTEEALKDLFYEHGYVLDLQSAEIEDMHVRFVEITEMGGLSPYPSRIMIQTWDEDSIYLQDITSPLPRKIQSFLVIDDREPYRLIVHSSGVSEDYAVEEEISFWECRDACWALAPMDLEIDASHAHRGGEELSSDGNEKELFEASYYRDGIAYRPGRQRMGDHYVAVRPGKMEEIEKNRIFRLTAVYEADTGTTVCADDVYIQFEIKQLSCIRQEFQLNDEQHEVDIDYPQIKGMEDREKERRLNALIERDVKKILEHDVLDRESFLCVGLDYEIKYMDDRSISILYKGFYGTLSPGSGLPAVVMATTIDLEEEKVLTLEDVVYDYDVLNDILLTDQFEHITMWDGEIEQYTVSWLYGYNVSALMEDLRGDDEDIEWYIDDGHFVIVLLHGISDYEEYAIRLQNTKGFLRKDFLQRIKSGNLR